MKYIIQALLVIALLILAAVGTRISDEHIQDVELREEIGSMILVGFRGTEVERNSPIVKAVNDLHLAGVILFDYDVPSKSSPRNIVDPVQTKKLIADLKAYTSQDIFVAVDAEGGYVNRLKEKYGFIAVPSAQVMGEKNDVAGTRDAYRSLAQELSILGFNLNFAPVVDVNVNPDNPVIGYLERSFSADPEAVARHASAAIDAHRSLDILTSLKHFPGHGSSDADSHLGLVDITHTYNKEKELLPYKRLIEEGKVDMVMTAHVMNRNVDPELPATLSQIYLKEWLRGELGYEGVIVSDDMQMGAIVEHYGFEEAIVKAVNAGVDLLVFSNNGQTYDEEVAYKAAEVLERAVAEGTISRERIRESAERIAKLK